MTKPRPKPRGAPETGDDDLAADLSDNMTAREQLDLLDALEDAFLVACNVREKGRPGAE